MTENPLVSRVHESELTPSRGGEGEDYDEESERRIHENEADSAEENCTEEEENENVLAVLFLVKPGNRETIRLLMRGMPIPATFGFPNTDGRIWSNLREFCKQFHPSISIKFAHPLHPFTRKERLVVFLCTVAFNALWSAFTAYQRRRMTRYVVTQHLKIALYLFIKHFATVIYAVVIRQLVICPGPYNSLIRRTVQEAADNDTFYEILESSVSDTDEEDRDTILSPGGYKDRQLQSRAKRLIRMKILGDRVLLWLLVVHIGVVVCVIAWMSTWSYTSSRESAVAYDRSPLHAIGYLALSELLNFFFWFIKFLPLFFFLYPIHRAQWYQGGSYADYLFCSKSACCTYTSSPQYSDPNFPRSVRPETRKCASAKVRTLITDLVYPRRSTGGYHLSTFRRESEGLSIRDRLLNHEISPSASNTSTRSKTVPLRFASFLSSKIAPKPHSPRLRQSPPPPVHITPASLPDSSFLSHHRGNHQGASTPLAASSRMHSTSQNQAESKVSIGDLEFESNSFLARSPTEQSY